MDTPLTDADQPGTDEEQEQQEQELQEQEPQEQEPQEPERQEPERQEQELQEQELQEQELQEQERQEQELQEQGRQEQERQEQEPHRKPGFIVNDRRFWTLDEEELEEEQGQRPSQPTYIEQLERRLEEKDKQLREYIAAYKSEVVEGLEKTKQRLERDAEAQRQQLRGQLAEPMIEVLEALERSLVAAESGADFASLLQGVKMVQLLMVQKLQTLGLERLATVGQPFDPSLHEAVAVVPVTDPQQDNLVVNELKPGFKLGDRLVRAALVQVGKLQ